jgi:UDP-N-acetylmuramoylalanine-D-glutamate ligase
MQKNLILGYGQTGKSFEIFLNQKKVLFDIFDENYKPGHKSIKSNAAFISKNEIINYEKFFVSPGFIINSIPLDDKLHLSKFVSDIDLFFDEDKSYKIGITGTNGKSSFTNYLNQALNSVSSSIALGNFGDPLPENINHGKKYSVIELSSFQLDKMLVNKLDMAILLDITIDHLDYHETEDNYRLSKLKILPSQKDTFIYHKNQSLREFALSISKILEPSIIENNILFEELPHRLEEISEGIFNDSKSTNISSLKYALRTLKFDGDLLMCGDPSKEMWSDLEIPNVNQIIIFGKHAKEISALVKSKNKVCVESMRQAIDLLSFKNKILFSPGNPSGNDYTNYEERGKEFCEIIRRIKM